MSKHTPGPWWVALGSAFGGRCYSGISSKNHDFLAEVVVQMEDDDKWAEQLQANARLISAAPELLQALQSMLQWMPVYPAGADGIVGGREAHAEAIKAARAAIAKATGKA